MISISSCINNFTDNIRSKGFNINTLINIFMHFFKALHTLCGSLIKTFLFDTVREELVKFCYRDVGLAYFMGKSEEESVPNVTLEEVALSQENIEKINATINVLQQDKLGYSLFLSGPPGTGKTMLANAIANKMSTPLITFDSSTLGEESIEEDLRYVDAILFRARQSQHSVLLIDEVDSLRFMKSNIKFPGSKSDKEAIFALRAQIENLPGNILIVMASNYDEKTIPEEFKGLIGEKIYTLTMNEIEESGIKIILNNAIEKLQIKENNIGDKDDMIKFIADKIAKNKMSAADIKRVIVKSACMHGSIDTDMELNISVLKKGFESCYPNEEVLYYV